MSLRIVLALLLLAPAAAADQDRGILLTRDAQRLIADGRAEEAVALLEQARVEWPDSPIVSQTLGDAQLALGHYQEALAEYERGSQGGYEHRSRFNSAVTLDRMAEARLSAAQVPLDPAGLPEGSQPEMLAAIKESLPALDSAGEEFLRALDAEAEPAARESIGAVNRRIDELQQMAEELQRRQDQQDKDQQDEQDQQDKDQQDEQDQQDKQQGEKDQQQDRGEQDEQDQPQDQPKDAEGDEQQQQAQDGAQGDAAEPRLLSKEEVQQLLEKLDELDKEGRQLRKLREAAQRRAVEKDW